MKNNTTNVYKKIYFIMFYTKIWITTKDLWGSSTPEPLDLWIPSPVNTQLYNTHSLYSKETRQVFWSAQKLYHISFYELRVKTVHSTYCLWKTYFSVGKFVMTFLKINRKACVFIGEIHCRATYAIGLSLSF